MSLKKAPMNTTNHQPRQVSAQKESEMSEWQPIETAPKDGKIVYIGRDAGRFYGFVKGVGYYATLGKIEGWISQGFSDPPGNLGLGNPTHWRPIEPPKGE